MSEKPTGLVIKYEIIIFNIVIIRNDSNSFFFIIDFPFKGFIKVVN